MRERRAGPITFLTFASLENEDWLVHGFSLRAGGGSTGPFAALNLGAASGDDPARVSENQNIFMEALGIGGAGLSVSRQVHGDKVLRAFSAKPPVEADGLICGPQGPAVMVLGADCPLVILADRRSHAMAVVHSGRRSTQRHIVLKALELMRSGFATNPRDVLCGISPCIQPGCYEVDEECAEEFAGEFGGRFLWRERGARPKLDLPAAIACDLNDAGVEQIESSSECVHCAPGKFFSYRRDGPQTGRMGLVAFAKYH